MALKLLLRPDKLLLSPAELLLCPTILVAEEAGTVMGRVAAGWLAVEMEAECSVGNHAVVLYDTLLQSGSKVAPLSLVMKGEILPPSTRWMGIPIGAHQG